MTYDIQIMSNMSFSKTIKRTSFFKTCIPGGGDHERIALTDDL